LREHVTPLQQLIADRIVENGPLTVAEYMDLALYHPALGYYATRAQRSGRAGDFYTSVDAGPLFGACLAEHLAGLYRASREDQLTPGKRPFDLVDAGAGNGRLARDILDTAAREFGEFYDALRLHLVERSRTACEAQRHVLGPHAGKLVYAGPEIPHRIRGAVVANELLDALPCHMVMMTEEGLREVYVDSDMTPILAPVSTPAIEAQLARVGAMLEPGCRAEVNLNAWNWTAEAARALCAGELLIFDYGYEAAELYSPAHASGTLARYAGHRIDDRWLDSPGEADLTSHVDFTSVRISAEGAGLRMTQFVEQARFLVETGVVGRLSTGRQLEDIRQRLQGHMLVAPTGLGTAIRLMAFERPAGLAA
jgi:SAM-dependent MidA family methyltransferase